MTSQKISMKEEVVSASLKVAPPLTVSGLTLAGVTMQDLVYIGTLIYLAFQIFVIVRDKIVRDWSSSKSKKEHEK